MTFNLNIGDRIDCYIKCNNIVSPYQSDYDEIHTFEILSKDSLGYYLYIPAYYSLTGSVSIDEDVCNFLIIDRKFIGEQVAYIPTSMVYLVKPTIDGCLCNSCKEFYPMSQPNQEDGSMVCWSCRTYKFYR